MSLNEQQRETTRRELRSNFELSELSLEQVRADLEMTPEQLDAAFAVDATCNPTHVWRLRDYLLETVEGQGKEPIPFTVLKVNRFYPYPRR